jgi:uncharacterized protein (TIGR03083 family)
MDAGVHYEAARRRFEAGLAPVDDELPIGATPEWDARRLLAHVVGVAADVAAGRIDGYATDAWTRVQVEARRADDRATLLEEWGRVGPAIAGVLADPAASGLPPAFVVLPLVDLLAHEHDLREASGVRGFASGEVWDAVRDRRREVLTGSVGLAALPPLLVSTPQGDEWLVGSAEGPTSSVTIDRYELWRSLEGRRTREHVRSFVWTGDAEPYLDHWLGPVFSWPSTDDRAV